MLKTHRDQILQGYEMFTYQSTWDNKVKKIVHCSSSKFDGISYINIMFDVSGIVIRNYISFSR